MLGLALEVPDLGELLKELPLDLGFFRPLEDLVSSSESESFFLLDFLEDFLFLFGVFLEVLTGAGSLGGGASAGIISGSDSPLLSRSLVT